MAFLEITRACSDGKPYSSHRSENWLVKSMGVIENEEVVSASFPHNFLLPPDKYFIQIRDFTGEETLISSCPRLTVAVRFRHSLAGVLSADICVHPLEAWPEAAGLMNGSRLLESHWEEMLLSSASEKG